METPGIHSFDGASETSSMVKTSSLSPFPVLCINFSQRILWSIWWLSFNLSLIYGTDGNNLCILRNGTQWAGSRQRSGLYGCPLFLFSQDVLLWSPVSESYQSFSSYQTPQSVDFYRFQYHGISGYLIKHMHWYYISHLDHKITPNMASIPLICLFFHSSTKYLLSWHWIPGLSLSFIYLITSGFSEQLGLRNLEGKTHRDCEYSEKKRGENITGPLEVERWEPQDDSSKQDLNRRWWAYASLSIYVIRYNPTFETNS